MKRKFISLLFVAVVCVNNCFGQLTGGSGQTDQSFVKSNQVVVSLGMGYPNWGKLMLGFINSYQTFGTGPFHLRADMMLNPNTGLGASVNYVKYGMHLPDQNTGRYTESIEITSMSVLGRGVFHFKPSGPLDSYLAFGLGIRQDQATFSSGFDPRLYNASNLRTSTSLALEIVGGLRYFISDEVGLYAEFGIAKSLMQGGAFVAF